MFLVESRSRRDMVHLVDFEPELDDQGHPRMGGEPYKCSCEDFLFNHARPCYHCIAAYRYMEPILKHLKKWQPTSINRSHQFQNPNQKRQYKLHDSPAPNKKTPKR